MKQKKPPIRSYVLRQGRISQAQQNALIEQWPQYGRCIDDGILNSAQLFGRRASTVLEIGFGNGESLCKMAKQQPETNFIGIEVHAPGVGSLLQQIARQGLENLRVYREDAVKVMQECVIDNSLSKIQVFFPDPWHKKRHHKRRLIQPEFVDLLIQKLTPKGQIHLATDWQDYAEHMMSVLSANPLLHNNAGAGHYCDQKQRPTTKFEQRGIKLGHAVWDMIFAKF